MGEKARTALMFICPKVESFVYSVLCQDKDGPLYVKFGRTTRLHQRLRAVSRGTPIPAKYFAFIQVPSGKTSSLERGLMWQFRNRRTRGEWFRFDADSEADKRAYNDGSRLQFELHLGGGNWDKVSVSALDAWSRQRKAAYLKSNGPGKSIRDNQAQAWRELDSYGAQ